jgi:hypothetical protein
MICLKKQQLLAAVETQLETVAKLALTEVNAIKHEAEIIWMEIDKQIELALGEKERSIGALLEHRKEHGC